MSEQATIGVEVGSGLFGLSLIGLGIYLWKYNPQTYGHRTSGGARHTRRALRMRRANNGTRKA